MRAEDLLDPLEDHPFKPFRIHLSDGTRLDVPNAGMMIVGRSSAVLPSAFERDSQRRLIAKRWRTSSLIHIVQFSGLDDPANGRRRRRR